MTTLHLNLPAVASVQTCAMVSLLDASLKRSNEQIVNRVRGCGHGSKSIVRALDSSRTIIMRQPRTPITITGCELRLVPSLFHGRTWKE